MRKRKGLSATFQKRLAAGACVAVLGTMTACGSSAGSNPPAQAAPVEEAPQQENTPENERQNAVTPESPDLQAAQPAGGKGQISLDEAKAAALADAGVSGDVTYTKEKQDYEHGAAVYEIEFYADETEYEYEINAETGEVYSKSVESHGHQVRVPVEETAPDASKSYIDADSAVAAALGHAGVSDTDVSRLKTEFDIDDGRAEYEIEFDYGGREYEYTISAEDGSVLEYEVD